MELLDNLVEIKLLDCKECEHVPMLGHLPCLEVLEIKRLDNVKCIGGVPDMFYGSTRIAFPSLKEFYLEGMSRLVKWKELEADGSRMLIKAFPCLEIFSVHRCTKLETFPSQSVDFQCVKELKIDGIKSGTQVCEILNKLTSLAKLTIENVESGPINLALAEICENNKNLTFVKLAGIGNLNTIGDPNPQCWGSGWTSVEAAHSSKALRSLEVNGCENLRYMDLQSLVVLETLNIQSCRSLEYITSSNSLKGLPALESLIICNCSNLILIPDLRDCAALSSIRITECERVSSCSGDQLGCLPKVVDLRLGPFARELEYFPGFGVEVAEPEQQFMSLEHVRLNCSGSKLESLPDQLQHATKLKRMEIFYCEGLKEFPDWIVKLSSLEEILLHFCNNLDALPPVEVLARLTNLRKVIVSYCSSLRNQYNSEAGQAWLEHAQTKINRTGIISFQDRSYCTD